MKDLALLVADKNMDFAMRGVLSRHISIGIRKLDFEIKQHVGRDAGVRTTGPESLSYLKHQFSHGILMLDWEGSGTDFSEALQLEDDLDGRLARLWGPQSKAIVIEPELDAWVWGSDNAMRTVLEWCEEIGIRKWLDDLGYEFLKISNPSALKKHSKS